MIESLLPNLTGPSVSGVTTTLTDFRSPCMYFVHHFFLYTETKINVEEKKRIRLISEYLLKNQVDIGVFIKESGVYRSIFKNLYIRNRVFTYNKF